MFKIISKPYTVTQNFVDNIGMYRLVSGTLFVLAGISILAGFFGLMPYSGLSQIFSLALAILVALVFNIALAWILKIPASHESAIITALILFFLALPEENIMATWPLVAAVAIGIASKYLFAYKKQHFMNPAAFGAAALSMTGLYTFSWWAANPTLFVPLLVLGVLVVMKVRKWVPVLAFVGVSLIIYLAEAMSYGDAVTVSLKTFFMSWPTLFLAFFMLTEPFTMPAKKDAQFLYGGVVGFLSNTSMLSGFVHITPEFALVVANIVMMPWRLRQKLFLTLEAKYKVAKDTYEFVFKKPYGFMFEAGQYLEWMLPHMPSDHKGIRRYFTIASSPTESSVRVAMKITEKTSSYKASLFRLDVDQAIIASQLAGDFVLPKKADVKLGFIAGGIGVTPFRSHIKYMMDSDKQHDTALYYCVNTKDELAYESLWQEAMSKLTFAFVPVVAKEAVQAPDESGYVTAEMIQRRTPDYRERIWYISGPPGMVNAYSTLLRKVGVPRKQIKKDFFPGAV
jgi:ferredoxin-NADP reductase/Na+-translocating ferredoxin:NAD+ oxidoreductase RnfD subunit